MSIWDELGDIAGGILGEVEVGVGVGDVNVDVDFMSFLANPIVLVVLGLILFLVVRKLV